ncbi:MAG: alkaline phosphatase, partial [Victivallaceae bacterium]
MLKWLASFVLFVVPVVSSIHAEENAKYVFLFIGDGMGVNQRMLAETVLQSEHPGARLAINSLPANGLTGTNNLEGQVTDSAASGTAIACGVKTSNGIIGLTPAP